MIMFIKVQYICQRKKVRWLEARGNELQVNQKLYFCDAFQGVQP